jgi:hypothetical protein
MFSADGRFGVEEQPNFWNSLVDGMHVKCVAANRHFATPEEAARVAMDKLAMAPANCLRQARPKYKKANLIAQRFVRRGSGCFPSLSGSSERDLHITINPGPQSVARSS